MTPSCSLCGAKHQARNVFEAHAARFPDGRLVREAGNWPMCDSCMLDLLQARYDRLAGRITDAMVARRPELFGADPTSTRAAALSVIGAFVEARIGHPSPIAGASIHIPDDAPPEVREGLARRALLEINGQCPCGARVSIPPRRERRRAERAGDPVIYGIRHRTGCAADGDTLDRALATWSATA